MYPKSIANFCAFALLVPERQENIKLKFFPGLFLPYFPLNSESDICVRTFPKVSTTIKKLYIKVSVEIFYSRGMFMAPGIAPSVISSCGCLTSMRM